MSSYNDLEVMAQVADKLHEPLLGTEQANDELDEEFSLHFEDDEEFQDDGFSMSDVIMGWVILPALLFVQFHLAFRGNSYDTDSLSPWSVYLSIGLFVVASCLFRHTYAENKVKYTFFMVLPEIIMDLVLFLILRGRVEMAYLTLLYSMFCLAFYVCMSCVRTIYCGSFGEPDKEDRDELEDSFSGGLLRTCSIC